MLLEVVPITFKPRFWTYVISSRSYMDITTISVFYRAISITIITNNTGVKNPYKKLYIKLHKMQVKKIPPKKAVGEFSRLLLAKLP